MRNRKSKAFTLIEMMAVVLIAGILAAIVVPQIGATGDLRVAAAARTILGDINYAQSLALAKQKKVYIVFSDSGYSVQSRDSDSAALAIINHPVSKQAFTMSFGTGNFTEVVLAAALFGTESTLSFDESGSPMSWRSSTNTNSMLTSSGVIKIKSGANIMTIKIEPYTGEVSISEG